MKFEEFAYRESKGIADYEDYIEWGYGLLEAGCEIESVVLLASFSLDKKPDPEEVKHWFIRALKDLGLAAVLSSEVALLLYVKYLSAKIVNGEVLPSQGFSLIVNLIFYDVSCLDDRLYQIWYDLWCDIEDLKNPHSEFKWGGLRFENIDSFTVLAAKDFVMFCETTFLLPRCRCFDDTTLPELYPLLNQKRLTDYFA